MKNNSNLLISLFSFITLAGISSCIKPVEPTPQPAKQTFCDTCLPPITTPGVSCKINGKPFISKFGGGGFITTRFDYYEQNLFVRGNNPDIKEAIAFNLMPFVDTGLYLFPNDLLTQTSAGYGDWYGNFEYSSRPIQEGYVYISKLYSIKGSIKGTFAFDLYSKDFQDTVHITDGRFFLNK
jgi:hypothetical protein